MRQRWRLATPEDIADVVSRLRTADIEECKAMYGITPHDFFTYCGYDPDNTYVIFNAAGVNVALAGVGVRGDGSAAIWMVATEDLENHQIEFLRYSRTFIEEVSRPFTYTFNWVHAQNEVHIKWLKWCGFTFIRLHEKYGASGEPFYEFIRIT
jgi:hypothetical protein